MIMFNRNILIRLTLVLLISAAFPAHQTDAQTLEFDIQGEDRTKPQDEELGEKKEISGQPDRPIPLDTDDVFNFPPGPASITFGDRRSAQRCFSGEFVMMCSVTGPVVAKLTFEDLEKTYDIKAGEYGICYAGRVKVFCDIRAGARVGE